MRTLLWGWPEQASAALGQPRFPLLVSSTSGCPGLGAGRGSRVEGTARFLLSSVILGSLNIPKTVCVFVTQRKIFWQPVVVSLGGQDKRQDL